MHLLAHRSLFASVLPQSFSVSKGTGRPWSFQDGVPKARNLTEATLSPASTPAVPGEDARGKAGEGGRAGTWQQLLRLRPLGKAVSGKCFQRAADVPLTASFSELQQLRRNSTPHSSGAIHVR